MIDIGFPHSNASWGACLICDHCEQVIHKFDSHDDTVHLIFEFKLFEYKIDVLALLLGFLLQHITCATATPLFRVSEVEKWSHTHCNYLPSCNVHIG